MTVVTEVEKLRLKFPGGESLLFKDLSLSFRKGEKVLILGPSGSGKSTLLQVLTGLIPNSVDVPMKAEKIQNPASWGYVFQDPDTQFCMPYVDEEIAFVLENLQVPREKMPALIRKYLEQVRLSLEDIHTKIQTLSGGMKQRLAIASVLALEPEVLFLDEPTALLDPEGTEDVWKTIRNVSDHRTLIIVEHKINHIIDFVDRIILFNEKGEISADGKTLEIFKKHRGQLMEQGIWYPEVWEDYKHQSNKKPPQHKSTEPVLSISNLKGYRGKKLKISVDETKVGQGEWIAVIGDNGAGKSTLLLSLMKLIKTTGDILLRGKHIKNITKLTDDMTFVFQNPEFQFVTNSVKDEIAYSLRLGSLDEAFIQEKVEESLQFFKLSKQREQHPYQLSMGQKRRLSVAAAIIKEQPILLLDEPTFGQDAKNTFAILEQLEEWRKKGTTIIMVTHDMEIVKNFSTRVWKIDEGKLACDQLREEYFDNEIQETAALT